MKNIIVALILLFNLSVCYGQIEFNSVFGIKGGFNKSIINGHETNGLETGFIGYEAYGALFSETRLSKHFSMENELLFSFTDDYHFIEIPVQLKYLFYGKFYVFTGPKLDFIVDNDQSGMYNFKTFGVSAEVGAQYQITRKFFCEVRYSKGFTKQVNDFGLNILDGRRNTLRFGLGIKF